MPLDPPLQRIFDALRGQAPSPPADLAERRQQANATLLLAGTGRGDDVTVDDRTIAVDGGEIAIRILTPGALAAPMPTVFFIHGGGWMQGNLDTGEVEFGPMASAVPCLVVSVEYRLAPEHPFPVPLDDCLRAFEWLLENHAEIGADPARIAVAGCSAGANLAAALCLAIRDQGLPMPIIQMLDAPCLDLTLSSPSVDEHGTPGFDRDAIGEMASWYFGDTSADHPRVSPLHEPDLTGLPAAFITVAELDPVRDDGERYLERLHEAGVPGAAIRVMAHPHGGWMIPITPTWRLVGDIRAAALRRAFDGTLVPVL